MLARYATAQMTAIWSETERFKAWMQVELAAVDAYAQLGHVDTHVAQKLGNAATQIDWPALAQRTKEIEAVTRHDVIAFLTAVEEQIGDDARWIHYGLTSSDVVDTAFALLLRRASDQLLESLSGLREALMQQAVAYKETVCLGRTHGQAAEVTTFGAKLLGFVAECDRNLDRLTNAKEAISAGKLSGAVGNYGNANVQVEALALKALGLDVEPVATQVVCRDRHAQFFSTLALIGGSLERLAVELRLLAHGSVREAFEPFGKGQRGSSAMPHKRNPILSENVSGLVRLLRGYALSAFENEALWHERDISHSSVERVIGPDATQVLDFTLRRMTSVVTDLDVDTARMQEHVDETLGIIFSEAVLLAMVERGMARQEAYGHVQKAALLAKQTKKPFKGFLLEDPAILALLNQQELAGLFDTPKHLAAIATLFERVPRHYRPVLK